MYWLVPVVVVLLTAVFVFCVLELLPGVGIGAKWLSLCLEFNSPGMCNFPVAALHEGDGCSCPSVVLPAVTMVATCFALVASGVSDTATRSYNNTYDLHRPMSYTFPATSS